ncbi:MAG TPA: zf-HC2 domain-containing protein, partial [bacterium]|nr:zf-HC2 domain-containing protein [bacterium]
MNCREARPMIEAWVDHELAPRDLENLALHLRSCQDCAALATQHASFVKGLREHLPRSPLPEETRTRALQRLRAAAATQTRPVWRRGALAGASAGLALGLALALFWLNPSAATADWTQYFRDEHQAHGAELQERSQDPAVVAAWLRDQLGHPVHVPVMPDAPLQGARISVLRGQKLGLLVYAAGGMPLSLFVGAPSLLCPRGTGKAPDQLYSQAGQGCSVVAWEHKGHFHVAVAQLALAKLQALARECQASA